MKQLTDLARRLTNWCWQRPTAAALILAGGIVSTWILIPEGSSSNQANYYTVQRSDFLVSVVEGGNLEAVNNVLIRNEVDGSARIVYLIPEGTQVKEGDLLVELDSAEAEEKLNQQEIAFEKAKAQFVQAENDLEIQQSIIQSEIDAAKLTLSFAEIEKEKFEKGARMQQIREAEISIQSTEEGLLLAKEELEWSEKLHERGFETKSVVDKGKLSLLRQELELEKAKTNLWMLVNFDIPKLEQKNDSDVEEARKQLERVVKQGESKLVQYQTDLETERNTLELNRERLDKNRVQLENTKIHAPQDGFVVYAITRSRYSSESMVEEGATVRYRQGLINLPDTSKMKVEVKVHESHINKIRKGLPAFVVLDSSPEIRYRGVVEKVGTLPDTQSRWANPNLKVYSTEVVITDTIPDIKPGVSANAEIVITNISSTLKVPIQAVTTYKGEQVVYAGSARSPRPVPVEVGLFNTKFIQILKGLEEGDRILLAPPFEVGEQNLDGSLVAPEDEELKNLKFEPPVEDDPGTKPGQPNREPQGKGDDGKGPEQKRPNQFNRQQIEEMSKRFQSMSREEREAAVKQFRSNNKQK